MSRTVAVTALVTALNVLYVSSTTNSQELVPDVVTSNAWSLPSAVGDSCVNVGVDGSFTMRDGFWYIDRSLEAVCGPRQVFCKNNVVDQERYCSDPTAMFTADFSATCYKAGSDEVMARCGVEVRCSESEMRIRVSEDAIWGQTASLLQLNTNDPDCKTGWVDGAATFIISLGDENDDVYWEKCGVVRTINSGLDVTYRTNVIRDMSRTAASRYTETHSAMVTREKCFMMHAKCVYAANGYVTGSFRSAGANAIDEEDEQQIEFDLTFMDPSYANRLDVPAVYTSEDLYARGSITTTFHPAVKASLRTCWATNFASAAQVTAGRSYERYDLVTNRCEDDSTFEWTGDNDGSPYTDDFTFQAFRFFSDADNYQQDIWIHCTIVACAVDDDSSQFCTDQCQTASRRARRALEEPSLISKMSQTQVSHNARYLGDRQTFVSLEPYNGSAVLAYGLFAVGGLVALASVFLATVLVRGQYLSASKYKTFDVLA